MDETTVVQVLSDCGDIDAAIRVLGQLRLSTEAAPNSAPEPARQEDEGMPSTSGGGPHAPGTLDEWVGSLVQEMAAAKDVADARERAARVLDVFSRSAFGRGRIDQEKNELMSRVQELQKDNTILKRAVQIQNSKLQERSQLDQEVAQLRHMLGQYQEQVRALELNNYSLALHLQQATNGASVAHGQRPPDVF